MMTKARLLRELESIKEWSGPGGYDPEAQNARAVDALLDYIGDEEITAAFHAVPSL